MDFYVLLFTAKLNISFRIGSRFITHKYLIRSAVSQVQSAVLSSPSLVCIPRAVFYNSLLPASTSARSSSSTDHVRTSLTCSRTYVHQTDVRDLLSRPTLLSCLSFPTTLETYKLDSILLLVLFEKKIN